MNLLHAHKIALDLEALVGAAPKGANATAVQFGGLYTLILTLAVALRAGEPRTIWKAFKAVVDAFIGDDVHPDVVGALRAPEGSLALGGFNFAAIIPILLKVLTLLLQ